MAVRDGGERVVGRRDVRGEPALVADGRVQPLVVQHLLEAVEHLRPHPQAFAEASSPRRARS